MENELPDRIEVEMLVNTHCHLREGNIVGPLIEKVIDGGADVILPMPNTLKGLTTAEDVLEYIKTLKRLVPKGAVMTFIPTMMVTEQTSGESIYVAADADIMDVKIYPLKRTTNSHYGVRHYGRLIDVVKLCGERDMDVHVHPEHPSMVYGNRDAEYAFLSIVDMFLNETDATIVWEHGTDARCIPHWKEMAKTERFYVTLTAHHLATNEDATFGDVRAVCKPPIKTERDRLSLIDLVSENNFWVMAGPDDAPHDMRSKHVHDGKCACGAYTSPFLLPLYAHALEHLFRTKSGIDTFINFTSRNARHHHCLPPASRTVTLVRQPFLIPETYIAGEWTIEPFWANQMLNWKFAF